MTDTAAKNPVADIVSQVAGYIALAISGAPVIQKAVQNAITFIETLFKAGVITKEDQDKLMAHVDDIALATIHGEPPPAWTVEPDPS